MIFPMTKKDTDVLGIGLVRFRQYFQLEDVVAKCLGVSKINRLGLQSPDVRR
jgi:hypothetical protein